MSIPDPTDQPFMDVGPAARFLGIGHSLAYELIRNGEFPGVAALTGVPLPLSSERPVPTRLLLCRIDRAGSKEPKVCLNVGRAEVLQLNGSGRRKNACSGGVTNSPTWNVLNAEAFGYRLSLPIWADTTQIIIIRLSKSS